MKILLVRHGEADHNNVDFERQVFAGSVVNSHLTIAGEETARKLARKIRDLGGVDVIYSSCIERSQKTAELIRESLGHEIPLITLPELNKIDVGSFSGLNAKQVKKFFPEESRKFYGGSVEDWDFPSGENFDDIAKRLRLALLEISKCQAKQVLIVGHAMLNQAMVFLLTGENKTFNTHDEVFEIEMGKK